MASKFVHHLPEVKNIEQQLSESDSKDNQDEIKST